MVCHGLTTVSSASPDDYASDTSTASVVAVCNISANDAAAVNAAVIDS